ncbi:autophagy-related protein 18a-like [Pistacia vera]|uniref:autophagy-related protein 18a-like n=1 Tax=Pistacia vera TaxID=55513 RepID=UPI0012631375|nr:autophagy-related protein 18a-like [Pistacia vera]
MASPTSHSQPESESMNLSSYPVIHPTRNPTPSTATTFHHLCINQDHTCFAVGLSTGFRIFLTNPYKPIMHRENLETSSGGIRFVAMLFRHNIMCLINGATNCVRIWDDVSSRYLGEIPCRAEVKNVKLGLDRIVVVLTQRITVYGFKDLRVLHEIDTVVNPNGLCDVSYNPGGMMLVCPGLLKGQVRVQNFEFSRTEFIMAHDSNIACLALTLDGRFLATASCKGTLIRVFNTSDGSLLQEVRRGADRAEIYSLAFSKTAQWLAVSSDKGTVHVFGLKIHSDTSLTQTTTTVPQLDVSSNASSLSFFKGVLPKYFSSVRSVAQVRLKEGVKYLVGFGKNDFTVVIVGIDGSYYTYEFDPVEGGEMSRLEYYNFMKNEETF